MCLVFRPLLFRFLPFVYNHAFIVVNEPKAACTGYGFTPRVSFLPDGAVCEAAAMVEKLSCVEKRKAFKNTRTSESRVTQLEHTRTV